MDFYYNTGSGPCRNVLLIEGLLSIKLNRKPIDLSANDHNKPEFLAINPQHCVPFLVDGDLTLTESRVICTYLISKYGPDDSLYPADPATKAKIDKLLYFDVTIMYQRFRDIVHPVMFGLESSFNLERIEKLQESFGWLNRFIANHQFAVGDSMTVADVTLFSSLSTMVAIGFDVTKHCNISPWMDRCKEKLEKIDLTEFNQGLKDYVSFIKLKLPSQ